MTRRHGVGVRVTYAAVGQPVQLRRGVRTTAVTTQNFATHVVGRNEEDIGRSRNTSSAADMETVAATIRHAMRGKRHLVNMFRSLPLAGRRYLVSVVVRSVVVWSVVVWSVVGPLPILIIVTKLVVVLDSLTRYDFWGKSDAYHTLFLLAVPGCFSGWIFIRVGL